MNKKGGVVGRELHVLERRVLIDRWMQWRLVTMVGLPRAMEKGRHGMSGVYIVDKRGGRKKKKEMRK
jgi:hypothetical protein